eukprot:2334459-Rhodomonas_salina.1
MVQWGVWISREIRSRLLDLSRCRSVIQQRIICQPAITKLSLTLTADQINEMHATDLKSGETLEDDEDALASAASTQPAQYVSEATKVGGFRDEVSEILETLQEPLRAVTADANTWQLRKRVRDLELSTRTDLGTTAEDVRPSEKLRSDARKHSSRWTNGAQVPLSTELDALKDQQLARCLAHHNFVTKLPQDWFPPDMPIAESH